MLGRFSGLFKKDSMTAFRNYYLHIVIFVALLLVVIINFVIPEEATIEPSVYYYFEYQGEMNDAIKDIIGEAEAGHDKIYQVDSQKEIVEKMKKNFNSLGLVIQEKNRKPTIRFIMQGHENEKVRNSLILAMKDDLNKTIREDIEIETTVLKKGIEVKKIPTNKNVLPMFILMDPALLGFILIAVLVFMEKEEGTIKAYMVSPGRVPEYLVSKIVLMLILGWISTTIVTVPVVGFNGDYISLFVIVGLGSIFGSSLGLILASFFDDISQAMIWTVIISVLFTLPFVSYFVPSFAPAYIKILPTYPLLFAIREAVFPSGNTGIIYSTMLTFVVLSLISYVVAILVYRRNLARY